MQQETNLVVLASFKRWMSIHGKNCAWILYIAIVLCAPLLLWGFPFPTHDGSMHEMWSSCFSRQLWSGETYPRWLLDVNGGLGSPTFFYYPPVPYYLTSLIHPLFPDSAYVWRELGVSALLALYLSGLGTYYWLKSIVCERAAMMAAVLYMVAPYHLAIDLYTRGAFAEFWAFAWMPFILYFVYRVRDGHLSATIGIAVSFSCLIMTHLPTTVMFGIVPAAYAWNTTRNNRLRSLMLTVLSMGVGVGLSAIYLLPALTTQDAVSMDVMRTGDYHYSYSFFFPNLFSGEFLRANSLFGRDVFWIITMTVATGMLPIVASRPFQGSPLQKREIAFCVVALGVSAIMMTPLAIPIYEALWPLQLIQFPWRFGTILTLAASSLVGLTIFSRPAMYSTRIYVVFGLAVTAWLGAFGQAVTDSCVSQPLSWSIQSKVRVGTDWDAAEYRPRWAPHDFSTISFPKEPESERYARVLSGSGIGSVSVLEWRPRNLLLSVKTPTNVTLEVGQFYYPGWQSLLDGSDLHVESSSNGLITVSIPQGYHSVRLRLTRSQPESLGITLSAISLCAIVVGFAASLCYRHSKRI